MKKQSIKLGLIAAVLTVSFSACTKTDAPKPDEQELITTLKIQLSNVSKGFSKTFTYKVENGFGTGTPGVIQIDTLKLEPGVTYDAVLTVLNEKASPVEEITPEILEKDLEHLFVFASTPATGNGSVAVSDGSKDKNGKPLNQTFKLTTRTAGAGKFEVNLMHQPTNKEGATPESAGGETDLAASFPVLLQ